MVNWSLEWSECDPRQCLVELMATWNSIRFKDCLLRMGEALEPVKHSTGEA